MQRYAEGKAMRRMLSGVRDLWEASAAAGP
jgi:hypothetical protein